MTHLVSIEDRAGHEGGDKLEGQNPRTGEIDSVLLAANDSEVQSHATRLREGQMARAADSLERRIDVLRRWADSIEHHARDISDAESADTGRGRSLRSIFEPSVETLAAKAADVHPNYSDFARGGPGPFIAPRRSESPTSTCKAHSKKNAQRASDGFTNHLDRVGCLGADVRS